MKQGSVWGSASVSLWTYDQNITNGLYANPSLYHHPLWEGQGNYTWTGPGQLLLDPVLNPADPNYRYWNLEWYLAQGGQPGGPVPLINVLTLDGGVIGWTGNVILPNVPGSYGFTVNSNLNPLVPAQVNVLGLGGEYSAGTMTTQFQITDNNPPQGGSIPVLLYKAGKNSKLDLTQFQPGLPNIYTGGTIIAGGEIIIDNAAQLNAHEGNLNGGPIAILNGGRLHVAGIAGNQVNLFNPIMINTAGTPDTVKNCGSVIEVDANVSATLWANLDFSWAPTRYLEKEGSGTLIYAAPAPVIPGLKNAWGLKLTNGLVVLNQLPVNPASDSGPLILNGGNLSVTAVPAGVLDTNPAYGFRNIVSFQNTVSTITVDDNAMFRTHGFVPNEIAGTVKFQANDLDGIPGNSVVHLSRNLAPSTNPTPLSDYSRGSGAMTFTGVTVYMSGGGFNNDLNVLPRDAGFVLQLNDGVWFNASRQNNVYGEVNFNNTNPANPASWVRIDGEEASPPVPAPPTPPYLFTTTSDTWTIYGTGYTTWSGTTEKFGWGTVAIKRDAGTPVAVNANTLLQITGGTFEAGGTADPFTDNTLSPGLSLDIVCNSTATGLLISQGVKNVDTITGTGNTTINGPSGTELIVTSILQNTVTIRAGCTLYIRPLPGGPTAGGGITPVPEPATWIMLVLAAAGLLSRPSRTRLFKKGV